MEITLKKIPFVTEDSRLKRMAYGDTVYAWLLLHSHYDQSENHNYIYKRDVNFTKIGQDIGKFRKTVSARFQKLLHDNKQDNPGTRDLIVDQGDYYILPNFADFQYLDSDTVLNLFRLTSEKSRREELIKTYAWLKKKYHQKQKEISYREILAAFGYNVNNATNYNRIKDNFTTLQGAGLIQFRTGLNQMSNEKGQFTKTLTVYKVNDKASQEWLDKQKKEE